VPQGSGAEPGVAAERAGNYGYPMALRANQIRRPWLVFVRTLLLALVSGFTLSPVTVLACNFNREASACGLLRHAVRGEGVALGRRGAVEAGFVLLGPRDSTLHPAYCGAVGSSVIASTAGGCARSTAAGSARR
jgi:hypothetical protein